MVNLRKMREREPEYVFPKFWTDAGYVCFRDMRLSGKHVSAHEHLSLCDGRTRVYYAMGPLRLRYIVLECHEFGDIEGTWGGDNCAVEQIAAGFVTCKGVRKMWVGDEDRYIGSPSNYDLGVVFDGLWDLTERHYGVGVGDTVGVGNGVSCKLVGVELGSKAVVGQRYKSLSGGRVRVYCDLHELRGGGFDFLVLRSKGDVEPWNWGDNCIVEEVACGLAYFDGIRHMTFDVENAGGPTARDWSDICGVLSELSKMHCDGVYGSVSGTASYAERERYAEKKGWR